MRAFVKSVVDVLLDHAWLTHWLVTEKDDFDLDLACESADWMVHLLPV